VLVGADDFLFLGGGERTSSFSLSFSTSSSSESGTSGINNDPSLGNSKRDGAMVEACRLATGILGEVRGRFEEFLVDSVASVRSY
jgi:hypothetical protein